ncbi:MAG TPA: pyridoxal-phosphate dependent enzyme [Cellvibrionaceae bacterium]
MEPFSAEQVATDFLFKQACQVPHHPVVMPAWENAGIEVLLRRDDLIDPLQSGNKFYKLFFNLHNARLCGAKKLLSFGGAHSNHLYTLAQVGKRNGFTTEAWVRGERPAKLSPTLTDAERMGMRLRFISRSYYRALTTGETILSTPADTYIIPEGGDNDAGRQGAQMITRAIDHHLGDSYQAICVAVGTGGTLAGIASALSKNRYALGISVLKSSAGTISRCAQALPKQAHWRLLWGFHDGGYGKKPSAEAQRFWQEFECRNDIIIEPVYTLKLLRAIARLAESGYWPRGTRLVAVHSGGLQGRRYYAQKLNHSTTQTLRENNYAAV